MRAYISAVFHITVVHAESEFFEYFQVQRVPVVHLLIKGRGTDVVMYLHKTGNRVLDYFGHQNAVGKVAVYVLLRPRQRDLVDPAI